jgi:hypothetical protein
MVKFRRSNIPANRQANATDIIEREQLYSLPTILRGVYGKLSSMLGFTVYFRFVLHFYVSFFVLYYVLQYIPTNGDEWGRVKNFIQNFDFFFFVFSLNPDLVIFP